MWRLSVLAVALVFAPAAGAAEEDETTPPSQAGLTPPPPPTEQGPQPDPAVLAEQARLERRANELASLPPPQKPALPHERRTFSIGTAGGAGPVGFSLVGSPGAFGASSLASMVGVLPTIELRGFFASGLSLDFSVPLGDMLRGLLTGAPAFQSDLFLNFNPVVAPGIRMVVGPGLGGGFGYLLLSTAYGASGIVGGTVRAGLEAGVEFLAADDLLGISLTARPFAGFSFISGSYYGGFGTTALFTGGILGMATLSLNVRREE